MPKPKNESNGIKGKNILKKLMYFQGNDYKILWYKKLAETLDETLHQLYRLFDKDRYKVWVYYSDQKASLELNTGGKISLSLVHFDKYISN